MSRGRSYEELVIGEVWRMLDHQISGGIDWIRGVSWDDVRWPVALRPAAERENVP